jgi:hypothetical protein
MKAAAAMVIASVLVLVPQWAPDAVAAMAAAHPWRGLVLVLSPPIEDELTRNAMVRIAGEFGAALFQVVTRPIEPGVDLMAQIDHAGSELSPVAAFAIVPDPEEGSAGVAVWVSNRLTRTTTVQRVQIRAGNGDRAAAQLAVETVDLVRASLPGLWPLDVTARAAAPRAEGELASSSSSTFSSPASVARRLRLAVGVGLFADVDSVPASWAPEIALSYGRLDEVALRVSLAGLGSGVDVTSSDGSGARLQRALLSLGVVRLFRADSSLQPILSAAVGLHHLGAQGTGAPAEREHATSAFSALLSAGGGVALALGAHLALTAEAEAMLIWPSVMVQVGTANVAQLNRPSVFAHAGLLATF